MLTARQCRQRCPARLSFRRPVSLAPDHTLLEQQRKFIREYDLRTSLRTTIQQYARSPLPTKSISALLRQSQELSRELIIRNSHATIHNLLIYNARRITEFRKLPYLVVVNPSILESYNLYLESMASLIKVSSEIPETVEANRHFSENVLCDFIELHLDLLPGLSKGFAEVRNLISVEDTKRFLDAHLRERISMRLIAQQHIQLTQSLGSADFVAGGKYNGIIKPINIEEFVTKNAEMVNDMFLLKYDQTVPIKVEHSHRNKQLFWSKSGEDGADSVEEKLTFPYLGHHLDYILTEIFKNAFRSHIENHVSDAVVVTISTCESPAYLELRVRDKGRGIPPAALRHIFDYSFTTFELGEGESFKTLNVPPGLAGNIVAGMGYGLPLSKNYIEIFNDGIEDRNRELKGLLTIQTYPSWGTDVYIKTAGY